MIKKTTVIIILLSLITVSSVGVTVWTLWFRDSGDTAPDYAPEEEEPNAESIPDDTDEKPDQPEGGGTVSLVYAETVTIDLTDRQAVLLFSNPQKSNRDMVIQLVIQDRLVLQSGRLTPGHRVTALDLPEDAPALEPGTYGDESCKLVVLYYDPTSGERDILRTEIPLTVTVQE